MKNTVKKICLLGGNASRGSTGRSTARTSDRAYDTHLDRLATSPTVLIGVLVASGVWAVAVLYWGL